jgi:hypothetical protein
MKLVFDLETDNLLDDVTKIHCMVTEDVDSGEIKRYKGLRIVREYDLTDCPYVDYQIQSDGRQWLPNVKLKKNPTEDRPLEYNPRDCGA